MVARQALNGQSTDQLYRLLPTLGDGLKACLYRGHLVKRSFYERAPLYLEGNSLCFYTSSELESVSLDEAAFRRTILEAQKGECISLASWVKPVGSSHSQECWWGLGGARVGICWTTCLSFERKQSHFDVARIGNQ